MEKRAAQLPFLTSSIILIHPRAASIAGYVKVHALEICRQKLKSGIKSIIQNRYLHPNDRFGLKQCIFVLFRI